MKRISVYFLPFLFFLQVCLAQDNYNNLVVDQDVIVQQVSGLVPNDILGFQSLNNGFANISFAQQTGNYNKVSINQQKDQGSGSNQSYTVQQGDANEIFLGQTGNGNLFLSLQLGYLTTNSGVRNKIDAFQEGDNNGISSIQLGEDNSISTKQRGTNHNLVIFQSGTNNLINYFSQENSSANVLFDKITQNGDHLSLITNNVSRTTANQNTFEQSGSNLSLIIENDFINSNGGMEINQTGHDMKIMINQSYFPTPTN